jgi:hypothetical protein
MMAKKLYAGMDATFTTMPYAPNVPFGCAFEDRQPNDLFLEDEVIGEATRAAPAQAELRPTCAGAFRIAGPHTLPSLLSTDSAPLGSR